MEKVVAEWGIKQAPLPKKMTDHLQVMDLVANGPMKAGIRRTPINKQIKCISQDFESYLVLLVASSVDNDWCSVIGSPSPANVARRILRFAHGRPP